MTGRQVFEYSLIELNKVEAPSLLLEDYNYFINKAIINYSNKRYNVYDVNQQSTDDLRVLKGTSIITGMTAKTGNKLQGATYVGDLPQDYFHILNCIVEFTATKRFKCYTPNEAVYFGAKRLTADMYSQIINNFYLKPSYKNPYFYLHNENEPVGEINTSGTSDDQKSANSRDANSSPVKIEIRYGKDNTLFVLTKVHIDYLKSPKHVVLTQEQIDSTEDTSQVIEFPDYVCHEIIKELVALLMENSSDPRLQTNIPVNQSIAPPAGAQQSAKR